MVRNYQKVKTLDERSGRASSLARRLGFSLRRFGPVRRLYLAWLNQVWGGVSMNMIATKPRRYIGRHEGMRAGERAMRTLAAALREPLDRQRGVAPERLPRSPEQAARKLRRERDNG